MKSTLIRALGVASILALGGCSSDSGGPSGTGGHPGSGGATSSGGSAASGGAMATGGTASTGGTTSSGGSTGSGGKPSSGGATSTGGKSDAGGNTGTGGSPSSGGATGSGGKTGAGGDTSAGGSTGSGGAKGGTTGSGGTPMGGNASGGKTGVGGATGSGGTTGGTGAKIHAFMLLGQSNMAGYAKAQDSDKEGSSRIRVIGFDDCAATGRKKDQWADAAPPLHECWNSAVGPGDSFSKTLLSAIPAGDSILLVPCALSGKSINDFKKGTTNYTWFISRAKSAQQLGGVIEGLLFHQGESDCGQASWPAAVKQFVTDLRTDLSLGDTVPFLAGELPPDSACKQHNTLVDQLPSQITNAFVVSSSGLKLDPADTQYHMHFGHDDTVELGKRFEAKLVEALKW